MSKASDSAANEPDKSVYQYFDRALPYFWRHEFSEHNDRFHEAGISIFVKWARFANWSRVAFMGALGKSSGIVLFSYFDVEKSIVERTLFHLCFEHEAYGGFHNGHTCIFQDKDLQDLGVYGFLTLNPRVFNKRIALHPKLESAQLALQVIPLRESEYLANKRDWDEMGELLFAPSRDIMSWDLRERAPATFETID